MEWDASPILATIGSFDIRWYGLMFVIGFSIGHYYVSNKLIAYGFTKEHRNSLFNHIVLGSLIGARLGHCLFYEPEFYLSQPWKILMVWEGGLASHGGYAGLLIGKFLFMKKYKDKVSFLEIADLVGPFAVLTGAFIRLGNFFNSEILGYATNMPWAITFSRVDMVPRHPAQLYESVGYAICAGVGYFLYTKKQHLWPVGKTFGITLALSFTFRFFIEFFKENQVAFEAGMIINMGQLLSIPMVLFGLFFAWGKKNEDFSFGKRIMTK